jgi:hypothetical protein
VVDRASGGERDVALEPRGVPRWVFNDGRVDLLQRVGSGRAVGERLPQYGTRAKPAVHGKTVSYSYLQLSAHALEKLLLVAMRLSKNHFSPPSSVTTS